MPTVAYTYKGRDRAGKLTEGTMEAESAAAVADRLRAQGLIPTVIQEARKFAGATIQTGPSPVAPARRLGLIQLSILSRQLAVMIGAGLPLVQALNILSQQVDKPALRETLNQVRRKVESGETFASSLNQFPGVFPPIFVNLVEAGEASGSLDTVLDRVSKFFEKQVELRNKVKGALVYPCILIGVAAIAIAALMVFVLPTFIDMFKGFNAELPWLTQALYDFGNGIRTLWYIYFTIPVAAGALFLRFITGPGKVWWDTVSLRIPGFGSLIRRGQTAQFTRTFGMLVQSGVPMLQALDLLERLSGNSVVKQAIQSAKVSVRDGSGLARPLRLAKVFPPMLAHMVGVGEETGALDSMLYKVADFYDQEVDYAVKGLTTAIEPAIILVIGVFAGLIVAAIMIPMFNMINIAM
ncbi:MAG: type II secretion system F family protein [Firmicutes bacterium]|jgi:type IV pilus assembly protein PilC|nr:type II secretion system F family protein [Bacillota bacterium]